MRDHQESAREETSAGWWTPVEWKALKLLALDCIYLGALVQEQAAATRRDGKWFRGLAYRAARLLPERDADALAPVRAEIAAGAEVEPMDPGAFVDAVEEAVSLVRGSARAMVSDGGSGAVVNRRMLDRADRELHQIDLHVTFAPIARARRRERARSRPGRDTAFLPLWREVERMEEVGAERRAAEAGASRAGRARGSAPGDDWGLDDGE